MGDPASQHAIRATDRGNVEAVVAEKGEIIGECVLEAAVRRGRLDIQEPGGWFNGDTNGQPLRPPIRRNSADIHRPEVCPLTLDHTKKTWRRTKSDQRLGEARLKASREVDDTV